MLGNLEPDHMTDHGGSERGRLIFRSSIPLTMTTDMAGCLRKLERYPRFYSCALQVERWKVNVDNSGDFKHNFGKIKYDNRIFRFVLRYKKED